VAAQRPPRLSLLIWGCELIRGCGAEGAVEGFSAPLERPAHPSRVKSGLSTSDGMATVAAAGRTCAGNKH